MNTINNTSAYRKLIEAASRTIAGAFETFLSDHISIPKWSRSLASESEIHLRRFLIAENNRDNGFPIILQNADSDFIGGSFARHTIIKPLDDIDIYFPLDGYGLQVVQSSMVLPIRVVSDGNITSNPITNTEWISEDRVSSIKLINGFYSRLKRHYPNSRIKPDGQAVNVKFKKGGSDTDKDDGIGFDIVPCFLLAPHDQSQPYYFIPSVNDGWIISNPRLDEELAARLHRDNNKTYRKVVRLIKYWNANRNRSHIKSYYIELAVAEAYMNNNRNRNVIQIITEGLEIGFKNLATSLYYGSLQPPLQNAPPVSASDNQMDDYNQVQSVLKHIRNACNWKAMGYEQKAIIEWSMVFGTDFPFPE